MNLASYIRATHSIADKHRGRQLELLDIMPPSRPYAQRGVAGEMKFGCHFGTVAGCVIKA